jgi:2-succinyl-5-enolpyruvyl-6-hydroxy-3-cyclohexene-1-carboxylate synthase
VLPAGVAGEIPLPGAFPDALEETVEIPEGFFDCERGVVVLGRFSLREQALAPRVLEFANRLDWPLIADVLSGARFLKGAVAHADWILQNPEIPAPERVLHLGGSLVSKRLGKWLAACRGADCLQVRRFPERIDPWGQEPLFFRAEIGAFLESARVPERKGWADWWRDLDDKAAGFLNDLPEGSEPAIARSVADFAARNGDLLFLGNSMPVRDVDSCAQAAFDLPTPVLGNRGASGIDGNIATIAGACLGSGRRVVGLLGDLAVLHDLNSLALLRGLPVTLVVINNDGGGIFRFLPLAINAADRERYWETPHGMDFQHAAAQFGLDYHLANGADDLTGLLTRSRQKSCVIECRTERGENHELHLEIGRVFRDGTAFGNRLRQAEPSW